MLLLLLLLLVAIGRAELARHLETFAPCSLRACKVRAHRARAFEALLQLCDEKD